MNLLRRALWAAWVAVGCGLTAPPDARALATNLLPVADTALRSSNPDNNFGAELDLPAGTGNFGSPSNRCLFKFDLAAVPPGAVITSATLRLMLVADPTLPASYNLNRVLQNWGEGNKSSAPGLHTGAPASTGEATWNSRLQGTAPWGVPGGQAGTDYVSTPSANAMLTGVTNEFNSPGLLADVQLWITDPGANFGWILIATNDLAGTGKLIGSREDTNNTPVLIIEYTLPAGPTPPTLFDTGFGANEFHFSFSAQSNRTYTVDYRDSLTRGSWKELSQFPARPNDTTLRVTNTISSEERYYRVRTP